MKNFLLIFSIISFFSVTGKATIINVPADYGTIQTAINASTNGDTVAVAPGTYFENINFRGKRIVVTSNFYLNNDISFLPSTIINGSAPLFADTGSCVIISSGEDSTTVLQGFTITGGTGTKWFDIHGAGTYREGGGILIELSSPVIQFNIIQNNQAINAQGLSGAGGGGIRIGDGNPKILNNVITGNAGKYGAGVVLNYTGCVMTNNIITQNSGSNTFSGGAGIWALNNLAGKSKIIENNTIVNNSATVGTGGVLSWGTTLTLRNNIIRGNTVGAQIVKTGGGIVNATYCNVQGGYTGEGNINIEPAFSDTNFLLAVSSPCVDAGDSSATFNDPEDTANPGSALFPARGTLRNDMGAYGGPRSYSFPVFVVVGVNENSSLVNEFYLLQNYPNPFNPVTTIRFEVRGLGLVSLKVFDVLGREVTTLIHNRVMDEGKHEVEFDASGLTSGVYFYRLSVSHPNESAIRYTQTKKLLLMK